MNINKVILMGRLTADPELKMSQNKVPVLRFTVAVNRRQLNRNDQDSGRATADFIDCVCFYKTAEFISKYFKRGSLIIVFGALQIDSWKDKNGNNQRTARVVVDEVQFGESRRDGSSIQRTAPATEKEAEAFTNIQDSDFFADVKDIPDSDDDLPF
jgi:single-strand DNA-binding protein